MQRSDAYVEALMKLFRRQFRAGVENQSSAPLIVREKYFQWIALWHVRIIAANSAAILG